MTRSTESRAQRIMDPAHVRGAHSRSRLPLAGNTARHAATDLATMLESAVADRLLATNPVHGRQASEG